MPLMSLPVMTMVVTSGDAVILVSPGSKLTDEQLRSAGVVTDIVAPNLLHTGGVGRAHELFPNARIWGPPEAKSAKPNIPWTHELSPSTAIAAGVTVFPVRGMPRLNEYAIFDESSGTLFVADLFFHLVGEKGLGARIILGLFGTYERFGVSRFFLKSVEDRQAFAESVRRIAALPIRRLVMAHGEPLENASASKDVPTRMREALAERGF